MHGRQITSAVAAPLSPNHHHHHWSVLYTYHAELFAATDELIQDQHWRSCCHITYIAIVPLHNGTGAGISATFRFLPTFTQLGEIHRTWFRIVQGPRTSDYFLSVVYSARAT